MIQRPLNFLFIITDQQRAVDHGDRCSGHYYQWLLEQGVDHDPREIPLPESFHDPHAAAAEYGMISMIGSMVGSVDIAQTLLELAGVPEYHGMQGTSLAPLLEDPSRSLREDVLVEEDELFDIVGGGGHLRMRSLVTERARRMLELADEAPKPTHVA